MEIRTLNICGRECRQAVAGEPECLLVMPMHVKEEADFGAVAAAIANGCGTGFALTAFRVDDWAVELMPWADAAVDRRPAVGTGAQATLKLAEEIAANMRRHCGERPCVLGGYSLAALFALWAAYESRALSAVAAASPSVWVEGWNDFATTHEIHARSVFLSLGRREEVSKNKHIARVGDNLRAYYAHLQGTLGAESVTLEWNEGGHFQDAAKRTARAFAWCIAQICNDK